MLHELKHAFIVGRNGVDDVGASLDHTPDHSEVGGVIRSRYSTDSYFFKT